MGWKKITGFQTRNVPHKSHEFLHKHALAKTNGILIQPIVGDKQFGDFSNDLITLSYSYFVNKYFTVPISEPEIVLSYKKTENYFSLNETARFDLFPFFFNVASDFLDIGWRVNEREINPLLRENLFLDLKVSDMPPTGQVRISASAKNARDVLEDASKSLIFKVY